MSDVTARVCNHSPTTANQCIQCGTHMVMAWPPVEGPPLVRADGLDLDERGDDRG